MDEIELLAATPRLLRQLTGYLNDAQWRFQPGPEQWSVLEVVAHLLDIERELYGAWVLRVLREERPTLAGPFNAAGLARERRYNQQDPAAVLAAFERAREDTVAALRRAAPADWERPWVNRDGATCSAQLLLRRFANHDAIHIGQIARCKRTQGAY